MVSIAIHHSPFSTLLMEDQPMCHWFGVHCKCFQTRLRRTGLTKAFSITQFNVVIIVLSTFVLICKGVMVILKWLPTILSLILHLLLIGIYSFSIHAQTSPDTIDPAHPNFGPPWYITHSCKVTKLKSNVGYCEQAKGSFVLSVILL
jgi:hypothetical protein